MINLHYLNIMIKDLISNTLKNLKKNKIKESKDIRKTKDLIVDFSDKIKNKTIQIFEKKGFFEYFSCKNGHPMGAKNFSWSAALYLDLKLNRT